MDGSKAGNILESEGLEEELTCVTIFDEESSGESEVIFPSKVDLEH